MDITYTILKNINDMDQVELNFIQSTPIVGAFDTETDGLHIIKCKPFIIQFGWYSKEDKLFCYAVHIPTTPDWKQIILRWHELAKTLPVYLAHNIKFDLHMLANIGVPYEYDNISDTQFYIRFAHDNVSARQGGVTLGLKDYCAKYIDVNAKTHEKEIQVQRNALAKKYNLLLKQNLRWKLKDIDDFFNDAVNTEEDFPTAQDYINYMKWKQQLPSELQHVQGKVNTDDIPYTLVNKDLVIKYALQDIVWVIKVYLQTQPVIAARGTTLGLEIENACIRPLWEMERLGLKINKDYVNQSFYRMRNYIKRKRQELKDLTGADITCNQHKKLIEYFNSQGIYTDSTSNETLTQLKKKYSDHPAVRVITLVQELRTLEKWLTTYLIRMKDTDYIYTQINQVGAASLRMSSDFQQFPKGGIQDDEGKELFNPRRAIIPNNGFATLYLDYSQIELRVQALYTVLLGHPDRNLCRAYMPYECTRDGTTYDYSDPEIRRTWYYEGWYLNESPETPWTPTDVHGATAKAAFGIDENHPRYKELRNLGKRVNFAKNYGAQQGKIAEMFPDESEETIQAINEGYYKAFPGIKHYQTYCYTLANYQPYAENLFGIRYWHVSGHNLINMLIQGSSATLIKKAIIEIYEFLKPYKTRMLLPIHDEIQFTIYPDELHLIPKLLAIMEDWEYSYIPIVCDAEITYTNWAEKEEMHIDRREIEANKR